MLPLQFWLRTCQSKVLSCYVIRSSYGILCDPVDIYKIYQDDGGLTLPYSLTRSEFDKLPVCSVQRSKATRRLALDLCLLQWRRVSTALCRSRSALRMWGNAAQLRRMGRRPAITRRHLQRCTPHGLQIRLQPSLTQCRLRARPRPQRPRRRGRCTVRLMPPAATGLHQCSAKHWRAAAKATH